MTAFKISSGNAIKLSIQDNVNTDYIISGRYKFRIQDPKELSKYIFEDIDPTLSAKINQGDFIVAGRNFGCGSSREQAPVALKAKGISAIIAKSFARIFYRNAMNIGLPMIECDTDSIDGGNALTLDFEKSKLFNNTKKIEIKINPISKTMKIFLENDGVINYFKKYKGLKIEA